MRPAVIADPPRADADVVARLGSLGVAWSQSVSAQGTVKAMRPLLESPGGTYAPAEQRG